MVEDDRREREGGEGGIYGGRYKRYGYGYTLCTVGFSVV
jgi:hypothetical protein